MTRDNRRPGAAGQRRRPRDRLCDPANLQRQPHPVRQSRAGHGRRLALIGPRNAQLCRAVRGSLAAGATAFCRSGLKRGDRILMFLDDTPAYPAAFFGAVRAGFVPLLINTLTPPDLLQFYLSDSGAAVAVADAEFCSRFDAVACKDTQAAAR